MNPDPIDQRLRESGWRRPLTETEQAELHAWLAAHPEDRKGSKGAIRKSNRTDNESAKMPTDKGVIQGYTGAAAVDEKHQIIVEAQAHGTGSEQELLVPLTQALGQQIKEGSVVCADSGYHSEANLKELEGKGKKIIYCNIGNPQALKQRPITYLRQVLALCECPELMDAASVAAGFPAASDLSHSSASGSCRLGS